MKQPVAPTFDFNWELAVIARCKALDMTAYLDLPFMRDLLYDAAQVPMLSREDEKAMDAEALRRQRIRREKVVK